MSEISSDDRQAMRDSFARLLAEQAGDKALREANAAWL